MSKHWQYYITEAMKLLLLLMMVLPATAQQNPSRIQAVQKFNSNYADLFGKRQSFIRNEGQYGQIFQQHPEMGKILFGYEGFGMPVLFTSKGLIHVQRKITGPTEEEREEKERTNSNIKSEPEEQQALDNAVTIEWLNASPNVEVLAEDQLLPYHTYAGIAAKANSYKQLVYKNLYPGIDLVFSFNKQSVAGFEYSLRVSAGANVNAVRMRIGGDIKKLKKTPGGGIQIISAIETISQSTPLGYYGDDLIKGVQPELQVGYKISGNEIGFAVPGKYDSSKAFVIDPFVTATGNLTGLNAGKAKDVDFDYNGNVYVSGGGTGTTHQLAKFNAAGVLQWTFSGSLTLPSWTFGSYWGGWMVEKPTGNVYLGQGFNPATGFQVIRITTAGLYDNFITTANPNFREAWKMIWSCNNGSPQILVAGGGTNSNINFGVFTPPSATVGSLNVTGIPYTGTAGWAQDIVDFIIDPANYDMYTIYGSLLGHPSLSNKIYKNTAPYSGASVAWNVPSGFTTVQEIANRPYLAGGQIDNSANIFAINSNYLFYWDGKNLKAFNKTTGAVAGTPHITANIALMQGGIVADACNNIFVGEANGIIKVYNFDGNNFNDAPADINIPGFNAKAVYDLAYDESKKLLYASGDGFVASFDVSSYCPSTQYSLTVIPNCLAASATVVISPAPPPGSVITYNISAGSTLLATNTTGIFTGLLPNTTYSVVATINQFCSGAQASTTFILPGPTLNATATNTVCSNNTGSITAIASGSNAPFTYSIDGTNFQTSGNFTALPAGVYTVTAKDAAGCSSKILVTVQASNGPLIQFTVANASCGSSTGSITANVSGGAAPYQYSINGSSFQTNNLFTGLIAGNYTLTVKDAGGCINAVPVAIIATPAPSLIATPAAATCGNANGSITAFGSGGTAPLLYSIDGTVFTPSNVFNNLLPGNYTVIVKDANGCTQSANVIVPNSPAPTVSATSIAALCNNANGTIAVTGNGGVSPLQYSINGGAFFASNIFTGLAAGNYTVTVKDNTGCTATTSVTVASTNGPSVTTSVTAAACSGNTGSITVNASGGTPAYQYSINGVNFVAGNLFSGLAGGNYVVYVRDASGCIGTATVQVATASGPALALAVTPTACGANTGSITLTASGGTAPLQYSIDGVSYQAANIFNALATGIYTAFVKDAAGCVTTANAFVANASGLSLSVAALSSACSGNSGTITAVASGGIAPLQYSINGITYQSSNIFTGVSTGSYTVYVKDANGCIVTKPTVVSAAAGPVLSATIGQQATCGTASGAVLLSATGSAPFTYSLDGGAFQNIGGFVNLAVGTHTVAVKDANGCTSSQTINIINSIAGTPPTDVQFNVIDVLNCTGEGRIKNLKGCPGGGCGGGGGGGGNSYTFSLDGGPFQTANQFRPVSIGTHIVTAKNSAGCTISKIAVVGTGTPATATATSTPSICGGATGTITIAGVGANTPYHASIDGSNIWQTFNPPGANSFTFTGLSAGTHTITIADDADFTAGPPDIPGACLTTIFVAVPSSGGPVLSTTQTNANCTAATGSITATATGGTAPYQFSVNGGAFASNNIFNNLVPASYSVTVRDATGCQTGANVLIIGQSAPSVTATVTAASCNLNNGSIVATGTGGVAPLQYSIDGTSFQSANTFNSLAPGNYTLYVKDANNCYSTISISILNNSIPRVTAFAIAASCGAADGSIVATGTGGALPYSFSLNGTAYQSSNTFNNISAGTYTVYIKDASGCVSTTSILVSVKTKPPPIIISHN